MQDKWESYLTKQAELLEYGLENNLIRHYEPELIANLRNYYYEGIPLSIILLSKTLSDSFCFNRALITCLGFNKEDNFECVDAQIDGLLYNPEEQSEDENFAVHRFIEKTDENNVTWVYDTSSGLVIEKELYYKMENPIIKSTKSKDEIINSIEYKSVENNTQPADRFELLFLLSKIKDIIMDSDNEIYKKEIMNEIDLIKNEHPLDINEQIYMDLVGSKFKNR